MALEIDRRLERAADAVRDAKGVRRTGVELTEIERVYSPVLDFASAIGRKPDTVTSVPVS